MRHLVFLIVITSAIPVFAFAQAPQGDSILEAPETLDEVKEGTLKVGGQIADTLPGIVGNLWNTQVIPVWQNMWNWTKQELWQKKVQPIAQNLLDKGKILLGREVEQRRPIIEQKLQQTKQELTEELQIQTKRVGKSFWERFKNLFN